MSADAERLLLHPTAARDLRYATAFYRDRDRDIAADFVKAVDRAFATILAAPDRWPMQNGWRRYRLHRFPFTIADRQSSNALEVGAIAHHKRRPDYWTRRGR